MKHIARAVELMSKRLEDFKANPEGWDTKAQKHLDMGTPERAYYHLGYAVALEDALRLIGGKSDS